MSNFRCQPSRAETALFTNIFSSLKDFVLGHILVFSPFSALPLPSSAYPRDQCSKWTIHQINFTFGSSSSTQSTSNTNLKIIRATRKDQTIHGHSFTWTFPTSNPYTWLIEEISIQRWTVRLPSRHLRCSFLRKRRRRNPKICSPDGQSSWSSLQSQKQRLQWDSCRPQTVL